MGVGEPRLGRCDQHVAAERELEAPGDGEAVDRADDRQRATRHGVEQALVAATDRRRDVRLARPLATELLQVDAGAERPAHPGQDDDVNVAGPRDVGERVAQSVAQLTRERVQRLRPIERQRGDAVGAVDQEHGIRHGALVPRRLGEGHPAMDLVGELLDVLRQLLGELREARVLLEEGDHVRGLLRRLLLALEAHLRQRFPMLRVGLEVHLVPVGLPGLCEEDQRCRVCRLQAERQVEQDEGIEVEPGDPGRVQPHPECHHERLPDQEGRGAEEAREALGPDRKPVVAEHGREVRVRGVKSEIMPILLRRLARLAGKGSIHGASLLPPGGRVNERGGRDSGQSWRPAGTVPGMLRAPVILAVLLLGWLSAHADTVRSGSLRVDVATAPFSLAFRGDDGALLASAVSAEPAAPSALSVRTATGWVHATTVSTMTRAGGTLRMTVQTTDPQGATFAVQIKPAGDGVLAVAATLEGFSGEELGLGAAWQATPDERFFGLGERANAVQHRGARVESYVSDGPWIEENRSLISALLPAPGFRDRDDATYFPVPWILSSRGYGVLVDNDETAYHDLATPSRPDAWSMEVVGAPEGMAPRPAPTSLRFRVFAGPRPADVLRRFTAAVGRQPAPAAPWVFGPWYQGPALEAFRDADVPVSVSQTFLHYLPCGDDRANEPARTSAAHALGYAVTTYFNPMICTSYTPAFPDAAAAGALTTTAGGTPYIYQYFTSRFFDVGQFDFSAPAGRRVYASLLRQAIADGHDGWMEDFGEYTPLDGRTADGRDGGAAHNRYPTDYHCAAFAATSRRPIVRFQRSGWTGAARCAQVVWSGDPTTSWDFDGLRSVVTTGLGMGLSGVSRWGSDIGGFFSLLGPQLDDELLTRWVQLGTVSGVMRTERDGISVPAYHRPQVEDPAQIDNWRRYTKLRTQLYPYIAAADREYRRSGMPIMRHLVLAYPDDAAAADRDDEFLFGPDLLVAPVLAPGVTTREAYLPAGDWVDFWRAVHYGSADGGFVLGAADVTTGGAVHTIPAPLEELPLLVRAGAVLAMLPPDVDTLASYGAGAPGLVRLADRDRALQLLAFPRGVSEGRFGTRGRYRSVEGPGSWTLAVRGERRSTLTLQASLRTLQAPFVPCSVEVNRRPLPDTAWSFDAETGVLSARVEGRSVRVEVVACTQ